MKLFAWAVVHHLPVGHSLYGSGAVRCDVCGRLVIRGQGRWWEGRVTSNL